MNGSKTFYSILSNYGGKILDKTGWMIGIERKWHGIEPDFLYRKRLAKEVDESVKKSE